ncbi:MAG: phosphoglycerate kinase [Deltaproteobacteria bacterium DG_8]|nr:MAG: phosphoglycerate kinase [Deltaproteobacteria bacterium DG_8]
MAISYIDEIEVKGKRVFIRADFNVPLDSEGRITDDIRIKSTLPTINSILDRGGSVILTSHLGRPKGKVDKKYSLAPVAKRLSELLSKEVMFLEDCVGKLVEERARSLKPGDILLLENLRFHPEEEKNDEGFAKQLAGLADIYINDAFAVSHRAHASVEAITHFATQKGGGFLIKNEMSYFNRAMNKPEHPLIAIVGGAKVSGKLEVLENLIQKVDKLLIGGGMAFTFLKAKGIEVGKSLVEDELMDTAREVMKQAEERGVEVILPVDCIVADKVDANAKYKTTDVREIPADWMGLDIGEQTINLFKEALKDVKTIVWNGPMGVFEIEPFSKGTYEVINIVADSPALSIVGGGDTDVALHRSGKSDHISFISTAGGAFLELLKGSTLPGIRALEH